MGAETTALTPECRGEEGGDDTASIDGEVEQRKEASQHVCLSGKKEMEGKGGRVIAAQITCTTHKSCIMFHTIWVVCIVVAAATQAENFTTYSRLSLSHGHKSL